MLLQQNFKLFIYLINTFLLFSFNIQAEDIISSENGGKAIHWTSEDAVNRARNLIDKDDNSFWSTSDMTFPQVLTYALPDNKRFEAIIIKAENNSNKESWANEIRVSTADPFPHMGGWIEIKKIVLPKNGSEKIINFEGIRGRYFRIEIFSNQGSSSSISLGGFKVIDNFNDDY